MKFNKSNFDLLSVAGGLVGGVAANFVEKFTKKEGEDNSYLTIAIQAAAGAAVSAFVKNNMLKAAGAGMVGAAGLNLAKKLQIGSEEEETTAATAGVGLLPGQMAIGTLGKTGLYDNFGRYEKKEEPVAKKNNVV